MNPYQDHSTHPAKIEEICQHMYAMVDEPAAADTMFGHLGRFISTYLGTMIDPFSTKLASRIMGENSHRQFTILPLYNLSKQFKDTNNSKQREKESIINTILLYAMADGLIPSRLPQIILHRSIGYLPPLAKERLEGEAVRRWLMQRTISREEIDPQITTLVADIFSEESFFARWNSLSAEKKQTAAKILTMKELSGSSIMEKKELLQLVEQTIRQEKWFWPLTLEQRSRDIHQTIHNLFRDYHTIRRDITNEKMALLAHLQARLHDDSSNSMVGNNVQIIERELFHRHKRELSHFEERLQRLSDGERRAQEKADLLDIPFLQRILPRIYVIPPTKALVEMRWNRARFSISKVALTMEWLFSHLHSSIPTEKQAQDLLLQLDEIIESHRFSSLRPHKMQQLISFMEWKFKGEKDEVLHPLQSLKGMAVRLLFDHPHEVRRIFTLAVFLAVKPMMYSFSQTPLFSIFVAASAKYVVSRFLRKILPKIDENYRSPTSQLVTFCEELFLLNPYSTSTLGATAVSWSAFELVEYGEHVTSLVAAAPLLNTLPANPMERPLYQCMNLLSPFPDLLTNTMSYPYLTKKITHISHWFYRHLHSLRNWSWSHLQNIRTSYEGGRFLKLIYQIHLLAGATLVVIGLLLLDLSLFHGVFTLAAITLVCFNGNFFALHYLVESVEQMVKQLELSKMRFEIDALQRKYPPIDLARCNLFQLHEKLCVKLSGRERVNLAEEIVTSGAIFPSLKEEEQKSFQGAIESELERLRSGRSARPQVT